MKITVAVIFGGESVEHEVSIISAVQAMAALNKEKYDVVPLYVTKDRVIYSHPDLMEVEAFRDMQALRTKYPEVYLSYDGKKTVMRPIKSSLFKKEEKVLDVVIPVVHGTNCEDGTIQGYLEMMHIPYSGCDVVAAGLGQDKVNMKYVLEGSGLPVCDWFWFYGHEKEEIREEILNKAHAIGYPLIMKPACCGSSVGIQIVHDDEEFLNATDEVTRYDRKVVVERLIEPMTEINCSVLGDCYECTPSALEQVYKAEDTELLDFKGKYLGEGSKSQGMASAHRLVPAPIGEEKTAEIKDLAVKAFKALGSSGVCRIDFMMNSETKKVWVNEINTIPGSLAFYLWEESGLSFDKLMDRLVKQAVDRQRRREKMVFSYDSNILASYAKGTKGSKAKGK